MRLKDFCEAVGFPPLKTWNEVVDHTRKVCGAPKLEAGRYKVRPCGESGNMWIDCDGVYLGLLKFEDGKWVYMGGPTEGIRKCGFASLYEVQQGIRSYLDTLPAPQ